jgi:uncharacterized OB-fold protein
LAFPYKRSVGIVTGTFLAGLKEGRVLGARFANGDVVVPPSEGHPQTGADLIDLVEVANTGTVVLAVDTAEAAPGWALVRLDGATTAMLHRTLSDRTFEVGSRGAVAWRSERRGHIDDIQGFVPSPTAQDDGFPKELPAGSITPLEQVEMPVDLLYKYSAGQAVSRFMRAIQEERIVGQRCPVCRKVYVPPTGSCAVHGVPTTEEVELTGEGSVVSFTIVNVPFHGQKLEIPYVLAWIQLDGADVPFPHLISEVPLDEVRIGMRVTAAWVDAESLRPDFASIEYFRPTAAGDR